MSVHKEPAHLFRLGITSPGGAQRHSCQASSQAGMAVAAQSDNLTFLPLDRDLRKGLRYVLTSRKAQRRMLHEVGGHGAQQGMFACVLIDALGATGTVWPSSFGLLCDAAYLVLAYLIIVLGTAFLLPPHELPYTKARLR